MKTDELRRALDDLAGDAPETDRAFAAVTRRARRDRVRNRGAAIVAVACVVGVAAFGVSRRSSPEHIVVRNPTPPAGNVADLSWTRVRAPETDINRIVVANGHTYAVGRYGSGASVQELTADGRATTGFRDNISHQSASVSDLIAIHGALVAVGSDEHGAAAWHSIDNGATWRAVRVQQPAAVSKPDAGAITSEGPAPLASITRAFAARGVLYAVGVPVLYDTSVQCLRSVWTSTDGTSFKLAPDGVACGGTDAADGPAGIVSLLYDHALVVRRGIPWASPISHEATAQVEAIAGSDQGYVAVGTAGRNIVGGGSSGAIWWSVDGRNWKRVVTDPDPDAKGFSRINRVEHTPAGWIAVGLQTHPGVDEKIDDAIVWTSRDGKHWTRDTRDHGTFEQFASAGGIGVTQQGLAIWGTANVTGAFTAADPGHMSFVLWLGSNSPSGAPTGIVEGTLREVGGRGLDRGITGSIAATAADGTKSKTNAGSSGPFSISLPPGTYTIVGHSPLYNGGTADCTVDAPVKVTASVVTHVAVICPIN